MEPIIASLKKWQEKIDERVIRERALIFLTFLAAIFMLWNFLIQSHFDQAANNLHEQLSALATERTALQTQVAAATQMLLNDPDKEKKLQVTQLQADLGTIETKLQNLSQSLIKADQLPLALQQVLQKTSQLTLLEVNTLPVRELQLVAEGEPAASAEKKSKDDTTSAGVYEHAVEIRVAGSYSQVVQFLMALEQLPWRFYWQSLDYKVVQYPNAEMTLRVYTLSAEEGLLGV